MASQIYAAHPLPAVSEPMGPGDPDRNTYMLHETYANSHLSAMLQSQCDPLDVRASTTHFPPRLISPQTAQSAHCETSISLSPSPPPKLESQLHPGHNVFDLSPVGTEWPAITGLELYPTSGPEQSTFVSSALPPSLFQNYSAVPADERHGSASPPEIAPPPPTRPYHAVPPCKPLPSQKRRREGSHVANNDDEQYPAEKRCKRNSSVVSQDLNDEDRFLVELKETEALPWKDIASRFQNEKGRTFQVAALQMRYKRLREKFRIWEEQDVAALHRAYEYWEKCKWEIISAKMLEFGVAERWPPRHCARKCQELEPTAVTAAALASHPPATTLPLLQFSSPADALHLYPPYMPAS